MFVAKSGFVATLASGFIIILANFRPELEKVWVVVPMPLGNSFEIHYGQVLAMGVIAVLALINYFGVKIGGNVRVSVTIVKVALMSAIIVIRLGSVHGNGANLSMRLAAGGRKRGFLSAAVSA